MRNICVAGTGYVGLVTGTCFADLGNRVVCLDINHERIENLKVGIMPIFEPGLEEMVRRNVSAGRLTFTTDYGEGLQGAEFVFICVGTPEQVDGAADLQYVRAAAESIADHMSAPLIVINKSTVPVGTGDWVADIIRQRQPKPIPFSVVSCPEFLREGSAIADFINPARTVLGSLDREAANKVAELHLQLRAPIMVTDLRTAEMIKYASNAFLATKISFINEIANVCEALGADVKEVAAGMGYDPRIGRQFLDAGIGYGGSCFTADETTFIFNSPNLAAQTLASLFAEAGPPAQGDTVQVARPAGKQTLAFDLETGRPTVADITAVTRRPYAGVMVELITSMGRTLRVTADHPVILQGADGLTILPAAGVAPGDRLLALCEMPEVETAASLNLIDLLQDSALAEDVYVTAADGAFQKQYPNFAAHVPAEMLRYPHDIKRHNRMALRLFRRLAAAGALDVQAEALQLYTAKGAGARINAVIPVDADLMRLCGYYLAEGYISRDRGRAGAVRERVGFSFHEAETEYIADVQRILRRWGLKFIERRSARAVTTIVSSRLLAWMIRDVLKCGTRSEDKRLPRVAFNVPADLKLELLRGAFSGDGAVTPVQNGLNFMLEYATVSKSLADGLALLLQTLGIVPSMRRRWMNKSTRIAYLLRVSGWAQLAALQDVFGSKHRERIAGLLAGYKRHIRQRGFARQGPLAALTVAAVEYEQVETEVYSLETSAGTLIAGSGLVCHNCFPKDVKALAHMATVQGRHPQLLQAVMDINADQRRAIVLRLRQMLGDLEGKTVGLLGLAFKPNTDDLRDAPAMDIAQALHTAGARVKGYDPVAMSGAVRSAPYLTAAEDPYQLAEGCHALVVVTEWNEFKHLDLRRVKQLMAQPVVVDGRNVYEPEVMAALGFTYAGIGRGYNGARRENG